MEFILSGEVVSEEEAKMISRFISQLEEIINNFLKNKDYGSNLNIYVLILKTLPYEIKVRSGSNSIYHKKERTAYITKMFLSEYLSKETNKKIFLAILDGIWDINKLKIKKIDDEGMYNDLKGFFQKKRLDMTFKKNANVVRCLPNKLR
jgi:hypothetical protein